MSKVLPFKHPVCRERTDEFAVTLMVVSTFVATADVTAAGPAEAGELAAAELRRSIEDWPKPSVADSYEVQVEVVSAERT